MTPAVLIANKPQTAIMGKKYHARRHSDTVPDLYKPWLSAEIPRVNTAATSHLNAQEACCVSAVS